MATYNYGDRFRYAFNITLLIGGAFGVAAGGATSFVALAVLVALVGMGVGGLPSFPFVRKSELDKRLLYRQCPCGLGCSPRLGATFPNHFFLSLTNAWCRLSPRLAPISAHRRERLLVCRTHHRQRSSFLGHILLPVAYLFLDCLGSYSQVCLWHNRRLYEIPKHGLAVLLLHDWWTGFIPLGGAFRDAAFGEPKVPCRERPG